MPKPVVIFGTVGDSDLADTLVSSVCLSCEDFRSKVQSVALSVGAPITVVLKDCECMRYAHGCFDEYYQNILFLTGLKGTSLGGRYLKVVVRDFDELLGVFGVLESGEVPFYEGVLSVPADMFIGRRAFKGREPKIVRGSFRWSVWFLGEFVGVVDVGVSVVFRCEYGLLRTCGSRDECLSRFRDLWRTTNRVLVSVYFE